MSFWDVMWFIFVSFAFVAYLMVMFQILFDLFRDRDVSGVAKAAWVVGLILLPLLTALIYLITRGKGMAERGVREAAAAKQRQDEYIRETAGRTSPAEQIAQARALRDAGDITEAEFTTLKEKALV
jgi:Phospholipase_D-nuclease N-terminal/Short C-terminal domain